jgi:hypothetical protein
VSFTAITLCVASERMFIVVVITPSYAIYENFEECLKHKIIYGI